MKDKKRTLEQIRQYILHRREDRDIYIYMKEWMNLI